MAASSDTGGTGTDGTRVLIIENDERIAELLAWFLTRRGWSVRRAKSFADARPALAERWPELCLSDVDLGAEDGRQSLPALEAEGLLPTTLVVSGYLDADSVALFESLPSVARTVSKPYDFEELEGHMHDALDYLVPARPSAAARHPQASAPAPAPEADDDGWVEIGPGGART